MDEIVHHLIAKVAVLSGQPPEVVTRIMKRMAAVHSMPNIDMAYRLFYHLTDEPQQKLSPFGQGVHPLAVEFHEEVEKDEQG